MAQQTDHAALPTCLPACLARHPPADGRASASFYIHHGTFVPDLIACIPSVIQLVVLASGNSPHLLRTTYVLRLLRLYRWVGPARCPYPLT